MQRSQKVNDKKKLQKTKTKINLKKVAVGVCLNPEKKMQVIYYLPWSGF